MLKRSERKEFTELRNSAQELVDLHDNAVRNGQLTLDEAHQQLSDTLGPTYREDLSQVDEILAHDFRRKTSVGGGAFFGLLLAVFLFGPGITGFLAIDTPTTIDIEEVFSADTTIIPGITGNISALRATGIYTGSGDMRIVHIDGTGTERIVRESLAPQTGNSTFILSGGSVEETANRTVPFTGECDETCNMSSPGPHIIRIEVTDGSLALESVTYSTRITVNESQAPEVVEPEPVVEEVPEPVQNQTNTTLPQPTNTTNQTPPINTTPEPVIEEEPEPVQTPEAPAPVTPEPVEETPAPTTPNPQGLATGEICTQNTDCSSGICSTHTFQGETQNAYCVDSANQCTTDLGSQNVYDGQDTLNGNTCYASTTQALWIADQGRFEVQTETGSLLFADKFGNAAIVGDLYQEELSIEEGWTTDNGRIILEKATGDLYLAGTLQQNTIPQGSGRVIQDSNLDAQVIFSAAGDLLLRGLLLTNAQLS